MLQRPPDCGINPTAKWRGERWHRLVAPPHLPAWSGQEDNPAICDFKQKDACSYTVGQESGDCAVLHYRMAPCRIRPQRKQTCRSGEAKTLMYSQGFGKSFHLVSLEKIGCNTIVLLEEQHPLSLTHLSFVQRWAAKATKQRSTTFMPSHASLKDTAPHVSPGHNHSHYQSVAAESKASIQITYHLFTACTHTHRPRDSRIINIQHLNHAVEQECFEHFLCILIWVRFVSFLKIFFFLI